MYTKEQFCADLNIPDISAPTKLLEYNCSSTSAFTPEVLKFISWQYTNTTKPLLIAEVGVWLGTTTLAMLAEFDCFVFAIDPFRFTENMYKKHADKPFWTAVMPTLKEQYISNMIHQEVWDKVILIPEFSVVATKYFPDNFFDVVIIDGCHETQSACYDVLFWEPKVKSGSYLIGDDRKSPRVYDGLILADKEPDAFWDNLWWRKVK